MLNIESYLEMADLFRFRWDPAILAVIADRPSRFRALATALERQIDEHVDDNALWRSLRRLQRSGHIESRKLAVGRREVPVYTITAAGATQLKTYGAFIDVYERINVAEPTAKSS
jgi:DNA-binding PadR family transcriptional regulator